MRLYGALIVLISSLLCAQDILVNQGVAAFKSGNYQKAVELFREAAALHPNDVNPHLYLGTALMSQWIPGATSPENEANASFAEAEFKRVLELDANNTTALASLASLAYSSHKLDEALDWYKRLAAADPTNKIAPYSMGVIAWAKWYPALMTKRAELGMKPEDPGPLPSPARQELKPQYSSIIEDGIANLDRALQLDPQYSDAMAYMNLLVRERADLRDSKEEYARDVAVADELVQKAIEAKKAQAQSGMAPPPPPPAPGSPAPIRVRYAALLKKVEPVYPALAKQARITGTVRFTITIAKDGTVEHIHLVSGHPLLIAAATDAVKQYVYKPTLLHGNPVEVIMPVDIKFELGFLEPQPVIF